jgi:microcystin-dependent protein
MDPIIGMIILWSGPRIPSGWLPCDGRTLQIATNQALFSIIGIYYGGNGTTTFNLPDLRSRIPMGVDPNVPNQGGTIGKTTGAATSSGTATGTGSVTIGLNNLPAHNHTATFTPGGAAQGTASVEVKIPAINTAGTQVNVPGETTIVGLPPTNVRLYNTANANTNLKPFTAAGTATVPAGTGTVAIANTGTGAPLGVSVSGTVSASTIQPSLFLNYLIATQGIYPAFD